MPEPVDSQRVGERMQRLAEDCAGNLRDSTWVVDGETVEAADRGWWLDLEWLLARVSELEAARDAALAVLQAFDNEDDDEVAGLDVLARRAFAWGDEAWHVAGLATDRASAAEARVEALQRVANAAQELMRCEDVLREVQASFTDEDSTTMRDMLAGPSADKMVARAELRASLAAAVLSTEGGQKEATNG